jgi:hypothetical protein
MSINHHNYEEYFILYMDDELGSDDRCMVEAFVLQHPDLKEELDILLQYKLEPDTSVVFNGKEELLKVNGNTPITLTNYEEWLVLYIDNELTADQKNNLEQFIEANPSVKEELALLMKAKLQPEQIIFTNKESLYRRKEKVRAIPVLWWRMAAAVLILALGLTTFIVLNKKPSAGGNGVTKGTVTEKKTNTESPVIIPKESITPVNTPVVADNVKQVFTSVSKQPDKSIAVKNNKAVVNDIIPVNIPVPAKKEEQAVVAKNDTKLSNDLPQPLYNPSINKADATNTTIAKVNTPDVQESKTIVPVTTNTTQPSDIVNASYKEDADLDQSAGKKGKFRGFFRKVTRTFEKRTNMNATDDDRFLVAGLAIKLK